MNLSSLQKFRIGMLGFGAQGQAEARNLRRSGVEFELGLRPQGASWTQAQREGFAVSPLSEVIEKSNLLLMNLPDQSQEKIYEEFIQASKVEYLIFAHGFNTHFKLIPVQKEGPTHVLIAPKGAASGLENLYGSPKALPAVLGYESATRSGPRAEEKTWIEALALALGCNSRALIWASFKDETVCDLFAEQALLCGGVSSLLRRSYEVLVENGYHPQTAYYETLYELKLIVDLIWDQGITGMRKKISPTARYGDVTRGDRIIDEHVKRNMIECLQEIESGKFAKEFMSQNDSPDYLKRLEEDAKHPIEVVRGQLTPQAVG